jgi:cytoskeletal protein RodZ
VPGSEPCKGPAAAPPAADAAAADVVHVVKMAVKLPMTREQFNTGEQAKFRQSIASAASVSADEVTIDKIENMRRSGRGLQAGSIRVDTSIVAADQTAAKSMTNTLTVHKINAELGKNGLPQAEILDPPQVKQIVKDDSKENEKKKEESNKENEKKKEESNKTPIVAAVVSSVVILFTVGACVFIRRRRTATKKADTHVWTDVAGDQTSPSPQAARASSPPVPTSTTSSERRTESPSLPIELDQVMMGDNVELDQVMMDVALTPARPTMTAVTPVQLPKINPVDFSQPPETVQLPAINPVDFSQPQERVKSEIAKRIKEVMSKANATFSADTGFIITVPMEGVAESMVAAEDAPARTSKVIPESTRKTPAPQETYTSPLFKENNLAYVESPSSGQTLAPVARMAQASLESDPANRICLRDRLKAMFPEAEDDIEGSEDEKDSAAVHR